MSGGRTSEAPHTEVKVRTLAPGDMEAVVALDALLTGETKDDYWRGVFEHFLREEGCIGLAATGGGHGDDRLAGYLFGEQRAFEFGSEPCGWIFAVGVHQDAARSGVASALLSEARRLFRVLGVTSLRTMVRRNDVPLLSFFRRHGFVGGPFVQLELGPSLDEVQDETPEVPGVMEDSEGEPT